MFVQCMHQNNEVLPHDIICSFLYAGGCLKTIDIQGDVYELELTNYEVRKMFETMINRWFSVNKNYEQMLLEQEIGAERIRKYGFAFRGKEVLVGD